MENIIGEVDLLIQFVRNKKIEYSEGEKYTKGITIILIILVFNKTKNVKHMVVMRKQ